MKIVPFLAALAAPFVAGAAIAAPAAHPDFTGVWSIVGYKPAIMTAEGAAPPLTPAAKATYDKNKAAAARGDRQFDEVATACLPPGLPRMLLLNKPFEILQRPHRVFFVHQENRLPWRAYLDEALPDDPDPLYLGYSVAHWDGDALIIDSTGFRDGTLLDDAGLPHSAALKLSQRYTLSKDGKQMEVRFTITDPNTFTRPWTTVARYQKRPGFRIPEEVCADRLETTRRAGG